MPEGQKELTITAEYIGPIISLNGRLSSQKRNLIFARNGMGKSFLSRAFRYLDLHKQEKDTNKAAHYLVSEESLNKQGAFQIKSTSNVLGKLNLTKQYTLDDGVCEIELDDNIIFHVFCSEFIEEELRDNAYQPGAPDPNRRVVTVDSDNIELQDKRKELTQKQEARVQLHNEISSALDFQKTETKKTS